MQRLAAVLLVAGAGLMVSWISAPAAPTSAAAVRANAASLDAFAQATAPVVAEMSAQVDRLRSRLNTVPAYPPPTRDPFHYGAHAKPRPTIAEPALLAPPETPAPPPLPRLVAIVSGGSASEGLQAAVSVDGHVVYVKAGDTIGRLIVSAVTSDALELRDPVTGTTLKVAVR